MKVAFLVHRFPPREVGGTELYARALVEELGRQGAECVVLAARHLPTAQPALDTALEDGVRVTRLATSTRRLSHRGAEWDPAAGPLVRAFLADERPDVVHVQHWLWLSPRLVALSRESGVPAVVSLADQFLVCPRINRLRANLVPCTFPYTESLCIPCVDRDPWQDDAEVAEILAHRYRLVHGELDLASRLLAPSASAAETFSRHSGVPRERIEVLPLPWIHATQPGAPSRRPQERVLRIGHWGHLDAHKGTHLLLVAARMPGVPPLQIHIWGEPWSESYGEYLHLLADGLDVTFHGAYRPADLTHVDVDAAVFPSLALETYSFVLDEATALGLPVIVPDRGAPAARLGGDGITFRQGSALDLARALGAMAARAPGEPTAQRAGAPSLAEHARALLRIYADAGAQRAPAAAPSPNVAPLHLLRAQVDARDTRLEAAAWREGELRSQHDRLWQERGRLAEAHVIQARAHDELQGHLDETRRLLADEQARAAEERARMAEERARAGEEHARLRAVQEALERDRARLGAELAGSRDELQRTRHTFEAEMARVGAALMATQTRQATAEAALGLIHASRGWRLLTRIRRFVPGILRRR